jgi:hypothetical protein
VIKGGEEEVNRTTMSITNERKIKLEKKALEVGLKVGRVIKWTDIVNHLIDEYTNDAADDMKAQVKER